MTSLDIALPQRIAAVLLSLAMALSWWPSRPGHQRLRWLTVQSPSGCGMSLRLRVLVARLGAVGLGPRTASALACIAALLGLLLAGWGAGIAAALLVNTVLHRRRRRHLDRQQRAAGRSVADVLGGLVAELRAGSPVAAAAEGAAADAEPATARALLAAAATARLGGAVAPTLLRSAASDHALAMPLGRLARAWALADRHGVALAELVADARRDLEHRACFAGQLAAAMSGPRATAAVLAVLPVLGVLLGQALGAAPLHVLTATLAGQVLLVVGVGLLCVGLRWSDWLISHAAFG